ncbi:MAG TPA: porin family protein [Burkholderiales bacterium]|nr:porin family protein [Burkholderiales bacterium]
MKWLLRSLAGIAACGALATGWAQEGTYAGVSYASVHYTQDGFPSADPSAAAFKLGRRLNPFLAIEARAGFGVGDDTVTYLGSPVDVSIDHYFGLYAKGILPLGDAFSVYGVAGVVGGRVIADGFGYRATRSDTGLSYGAGIDIALGRRWGLNFEWAELFKDSDFKVQGTSFGMTYRY